MLRNKKGQILEKFGTLAAAVLVLAIVLIVSFLFMSNTKESIVSSANTQSFTNATKTLTNNSVTLFPECIPDEDIAITTIYNGTDSATSIALGSANYSVSANRVTMNVQGAISYAAATKATYTCKEADLGYNATGTLQTESYNVTSWISIIIVVFIAVLLIGLARKLRE